MLLATCGLGLLVVAVTKGPGTGFMVGLAFARADAEAAFAANVAKVQGAVACLHVAGEDPSKVATVRNKIRELHDRRAASVDLFDALEDLLQRMQAESPAAALRCV